MIDLAETYRRIAHPWAHDQLATAYREAVRQGTGPNLRADENLTRPIALVATAIPSCATLNVAIHALHVIPVGARDEPARELLATAERNAADALHRCHRALELDGQRHGYVADEWLATVYDIAGPLLQSAQPGQEPPAVVWQAQEAISWLSRAVLELDADSPEAPSTLADTLGRLFSVWVFASVARD